MNEEVDEGEGFGRRRGGCLGSRSKSGRARSRGCCGSDSGSLGRWSG